MKACKELVAARFELPWVDRHVPRMPETAVQERQEVLKKAGIVVEISPAPVTVAPPPKKAVDRVKYVCGGCGIKAWAASGVELECGVCSVTLVPFSWKDV